jgi:hypothetical protein
MIELEAAMRAPLLFGLAVGGPFAVALAAARRAVISEGMHGWWYVAAAAMAMLATQANLLAFGRSASAWAVAVALAVIAGWAILRAVCDARRRRVYDDSAGAERI